ncbi:unnamed protein product [Calypogeia fissa]
MTLRTVTGLLGTNVACGTTRLQGLQELAATHSSLSGSGTLVRYSGPDSGLVLWSTFPSPAYFTVATTETFAASCLLTVPFSTSLSGGPEPPTPEPDGRRPDLQVRWWRTKDWNLGTMGRRSEPAALQYFGRRARYFGRRQFVDWAFQQFTASLLRGRDTEPTDRKYLGRRTRCEGKSAGGTRYLGRRTQSFRTGSSGPMV